MEKLSVVFKRLVCIFFVFIILCPMILGTVSELFRIKTDVSLTNDNGCSETPVFSWYSFADGDFQRQFEQYLNNNLAGRGYMIKTYNQVNVFLFNQLKKQEIKDGYFYETLYLRDYCGMSYNPDVPEVKQRIDNYMSSLEQISRKLSLMGKKLIVYSSVSKFEYFEEYIPFRYKYIKDKKQFDYTAIDYFNDRISDYDVTYIKGRDLL